MSFFAKRAIIYISTYENGKVTDVINAATGLKVKYSEGEEVVNVCLAIKEMMEESRLEGEIIGVIRSGRRRRISQDEMRQYIMEEYHKSEEEADELMEMYWK